MSKQPAKLLYASTEASADALYFSGFFVPDPVVLLEAGRQKVGVFSRLEIGRAEKESSLDLLYAYEDLIKYAREAYGVKQPGPAELIRALAEDFGLTAFSVPGDFPHAVAAKLIAAGLKIEAGEGMFFPEREKKTEAEACAVAEGNKASAAGIRAAEQALRRSKIERGYLKLDGKRLTSERLRVIIQTACLEAGAIADHVICAGGDQACDPHCIGEGPLRANELIIVDVFPRVMKTGYHGDMTRTFLKGKATPEQKRLVATVHAAQKAALGAIKARTTGKLVHTAAAKTFEEAGYETGQVDGVWQGFIHSTGHGLGLEVHESPRVSTATNRLKAGAVITVEPGLYYPGLGGCRIEDVVQVTGDGYQLLSKAPYKWELK